MKYLNTFITNNLYNQFVFSIDRHLAYIFSSIEKKQFLLQMKVGDRILVSSQEDNLVIGGEVYFDKHY
jgi:hypothetical protein